MGFEYLDLNSLSVVTRKQAEDALDALTRIGGSASDQLWTPMLVEHLTLYILGLTALIYVLMTILIWRGKIPATTSNDLLRLFMTPAIVVLAVILVIVGYETTQITPVIGLMGTIAGFLFGQMTTRSKTDHQSQTHNSDHSAAG